MAFVGGGREREMVADKTQREAGYSCQFLASFECPQQRCSGGKPEGLVDKSCVFCSGGGSFDVGGYCSGEVIGRRDGGSRWRWGRCSEWDYPQSCAGAFVGAQNCATAIQDGASNFGEGQIAAGIAQCDNQDEGVGRQVGDNVGMASSCGERGNVQHACVRWRHMLTIGQMGNDGLGGWYKVGRGGS